jgi:hypothetical protein
VYPALIWPGTAPGKVIRISILPRAPYSRFLYCKEKRDRERERDEPSRTRTTIDPPSSPNAHGAVAGIQCVKDLHHRSIDQGFPALLQARAPPSYIRRHPSHSDVHHIV